MLLRRGHILLIAGGVVTAASLAMFGFYGAQLSRTLEAEGRVTIEPAKSVRIEQNMTGSGLGTFVAAFTDLGDTRPGVTILDPTGQVILQTQLDSPIVMQVFSAAAPGVYSMNVTNPSASKLEASLLLGSQEEILAKAGVVLPEITVALTLLLIAGVGAIVAGIVVTIADRRRLGKMKQYGDTSDLV